VITPTAQAASKVRNNIMIYYYDIVNDLQD
jgi:hypothetical protein